jgi:hypothetical protein
MTIRKAPYGKLILPQGALRFKLCLVSRYSDPLRFGGFNLRNANR